MINKEGMDVVDQIQHFDQATQSFDLVLDMTIIEKSEQ